MFCAISIWQPCLNLTYLTHYIWQTRQTSKSIIVAKLIKTATRAGAVQDTLCVQSEKDNRTFCELNNNPCGSNVKVAACKFGACRFAGMTSPCRGRTEKQTKRSFGRVGSAVTLTEKLFIDKPGPPPVFAIVCVDVDRKTNTIHSFVNKLCGMMCVLHNVYKNKWVGSKYTFLERCDLEVDKSLIFCENNNQ